MNRFLRRCAPAVAAVAVVASASAVDMRPSDRYVIDLAIAGMPILLDEHQYNLALTQPMNFDNFPAPGQGYLNVLASNGWQPAHGDGSAAPVEDAFATPGAAYLYTLEIAGWEPPGSGMTGALATPSERYFEMLSTAGWQPGELLPTATAAAAQQTLAYAVQRARHQLAE